MESVSRPSWRYMWFCVRVLIILVLVLGFWLVWIVHLAQIQREAVAAIRRTEVPSYTTGNGTMGIRSRQDNLGRRGGLWLKSDSISSVMPLL